MLEGAAVRWWPAVWFRGTGPYHASEKSTSCRRDLEKSSRPGHSAAPEMFIRFKWIRSSKAGKGLDHKLADDGFSGKGANISVRSKFL